MNMVITEYKLVIEETVGNKYYGIDSFEDKINQMIKRGWQPQGGITRTAVVRGRLTVQEHTITQAMVKYSS
jgi:hypothetical protein